MTRHRIRLAALAATAATFTAVALLGQGEPKAAAAKMQAAAEKYVAALSPELLESICKADQEVFGADRGFLLKSLHEDAPEFTAEVGNDGRIEGYAFGRRGSFADHLGPWMAKDATGACQLLERFVAHSSRGVQTVDYLKSNAIAGDLLRSFGFCFSRSLTRMYRGSNDHPGRSELLCAILGPEFG